MNNYQPFLKLTSEETSLILGTGDKIEETNILKYYSSLITPYYVETFSNLSSKAASFEIVPDHATPVVFSGGYVTEHNGYLIASDYNWNSGEGACFVYKKQADGTYGQKFTIATPYVDPSSRWGYISAMYGDYMAVAGYEYGAAKGIVYIYEKTGDNSWGNPQIINNTDPSPYGRLGKHMAMHGNYLAIACNSIGKVFMYRRTTGNTWVLSETILEPAPEIPGEYGGFGYGLDLQGDYLGIGSKIEKIGGNRYGRARVYKRVSQDSMGSPVIVDDPNPVSSSYFGDEVAIDGDYMAVGALKSNSNAGKLVVFRKTSNNTWGEGFTIYPPVPTTSGYFGRQIKIRGDYLVTGSYKGNYVAMYKRTGLNAWTLHSFVQEPTKGYFGICSTFSEDGDHWIIGAQNYNRYTVYEL